MEPPRWAVVRAACGPWTVAAFASPEWDAAAWRFCVSSRWDRAAETAERLNLNSAGARGDEDRSPPRKPDRCACRTRRG